MRAIRLIATKYKMLISQSATLQQLQEFAELVIYKYRKEHKYATILQSILVQILLREQKGYTVTLHHVNSHLLDHELLPNSKHEMKKVEREKKLTRLQSKHGDLTRFLLEGNFGADRLCETVHDKALHHNIQLYSASLPQFIIRDPQTNEYASADLHPLCQRQTCKKPRENHVRGTPRTRTHKVFHRSRLGGINLANAKQHKARRIIDCLSVQTKEQLINDTTLQL
jgi:hypothetical protein